MVMDLKRKRSCSILEESRFWDLQSMLISSEVVVGSVAGMLGEAGLADAWVNRLLESLGRT